MYWPIAMSKLPWELDKLGVSALGFVFGSLEIELSMKLRPIRHDLECRSGFD
jgi:hypothetical protein